MTGKICTKCDQHKPVDQFYSGRADCKKCKNRQTVQQKQRRWQDKPLAYREMLLKNSQRLREQREEDPERFRIYRRRYLSDPANRARKNWRTRASRAGVTVDLLNRVWQRDGGKCQMCGSTESIHIDHVLPVSLNYGVSNESDLQLLCQDCNLFKSNNLILPGGGMMIMRRSP